MTYKIDVNIVDDHTLLVQSLAEAINRSEVAHVSHTYPTLALCRQKMPEWHPDVLLLDISMPDGNGIEFCSHVLATYPTTRVIAITCHDEYSVIQQMLDLGVHGYVLKSVPVTQLIEAITTVFHGKRFVCPEAESILQKGASHQVQLTPVEREVLRLICNGMTNPEIATQIHLSPETINWYRKRLLSKFNVKNSVTLALIATREQHV